MKALHLCGCFWLLPWFLIIFGKWKIPVLFDHCIYLDRVRCLCLWCCLFIWQQEKNKSIGVAFFCVGGISWLTLYIAERILGVDIIDGIRALFWQLVIGHAYHVNAPLWYMAVLIWITVLFYVLFLSDSKGSIYIVHVLSFVALIMQYTGFNYSLFKDFPFEVKFPLGCILSR